MCYEDNYIRSVCLARISAAATLSTAAGSLDPAFGQGGKAQLNLGVSAAPSIVLLQSTGKIIVVREPLHQLAQFCRSPARLIQTDGKVVVAGGASRCAKCYS